MKDFIEEIEKIIDEEEGVLKVPLIKSKSKKAFSENVREMVKAGHPVDQSVAAAYSVKRKAKKRKSKK